MVAVQADVGVRLIAADADLRGLCDPRFGIDEDLAGIRLMTSQTEQVGRAMIRVARDGFPKPVLESEDVNRL